MNIIIKGKSFYNEKSCKYVKQESEIKRIKSLKIPPVWTHVKIADSKLSKIQVTGFDSKDRKQYLYHPLWRKYAEEEKFMKMKEISKYKKKLDSIINKDIEENLTTDCLCACLIMLMDKTYMRIGNECYVTDNNSYGLSTLRNNHVNIKNNIIKLSFKGKRNILQTKIICHEKISNVMKKLIKNKKNKTKSIWVNCDGVRVDSEDVNKYLKRKLKKINIIPKDIRTYTANCVYIKELIKAGDLHTNPKKICVAAIKNTAIELGNTPEICKKSYIIPFITETYMKLHLSKNKNTINKNNFKRLSRYKDPLIIFFREHFNKTTFRT